MSEMDLAPLGDFKPEKGNHRMDKFKDHLVVHAELNNRDQEYFEKMKKAWSWATKMFSPQKVVEMLHTEYGHEKTHAYQILRDSYELWGDAYELDKRGAAKILVESAYVALQIAVRDKDGALILKAVKELRDLQQIDKAETAVPPDVAMPAGTRVYVFNGSVNMAAPDSQPPNDVEDGTYSVG
ncbi:hypothetical protein GCM10007390_17550 [Persicitalea jodogahamensis]|uniref:Uncharacterized protein n=2 Tax=Persicitalea jodogahamensis TaxID=402147 RepID=A0A8J3D7G2_9BACT|nr:hypothetical protein [Persicitalea jodogahamensis]GHB64160.1 hypothetical protein GCM10007390_17550 [Persicitalea jodogahamensis]